MRARGQRDRASRRAGAARLARLVGAFGVASVAGTMGVVGLSGGAAAAATDTGGCGSNVNQTTLTGYTASADGFGAQVAFTVPNLLPFTGNLVEDDVSFSRLSAEAGPQITAQGAPWWPGDILGNLGSLISEFGYSGIPNDPLQALAAYPPSPSEPEDSTFPSANGKNILPAGLPLSVAAATAHAGPDPKQNGVVDASDSSTLADLAAGSGTAGVHIGSISSDGSMIPGASCLTTTADVAIGAIDIAGMVHISGITASAVAKSDGVTGEPTATLKVGNVTVDNMSAYIDSTGIHLFSTDVPTNGLSPAQVQALLNNTFAQDGLSVRLLDPSTTVNGAEGKADAGGLVITISHAVDIPYIPGEPTIPLPVLGNQALPAGLYQAQTTLTLADAQADSNGGSFSQTSLGSTTTLGGTGGATLGAFGLGGTTSLGLPSGPGTVGPSSSAGILPRLLHFPIRGIPAPIGWVVFGLIMCVIFSYPMMLAARWQFLSGRR